VLSVLCTLATIFELIHQMNQLAADRHVSPETTARYVHLSVEQLAAECGAARATLAGAPR
jgi:hypothetical protein